jgi:hypothetical protein
MTQSTDVLYTSKIHTTGGRDGGCSHSADGRLEVRLSVPGTPGMGANPEQLLAAGWSAHFIGAAARILAPVAFALCASVAFAQTARDIRGPAAVVPLDREPPARIVIDPPLADQLAFGRVVIQYRTENLRIVQVFGPAALSVSPRIGHVHVTVDDAPWHWADASGEPVILNGLAPGPHKVLIELVNANHQPLVEGAIDFVIPPMR